MCDAGGLMRRDRVSGITEVEASSGGGDELLIAAMRGATASDSCE